MREIENAGLSGDGLTSLQDTLKTCNIEQIIKALLALETIKDGSANFATIIKPLIEVWQVALKYKAEGKENFEGFEVNQELDGIISTDDLGEVDESGWQRIVNNYHLRLQDATSEIGRASCRERV